MLFHMFSYLIASSFLNIAIMIFCLLVCAAITSHLFLVINFTISLSLIGILYYEVVILLPLSDQIHHSFTSDASKFSLYKRKQVT